ncbi:hypothetical protein ACFFWE_24320 [Sphaerisporangium melleum]|nr:hypothetical protein [Sphaerisporangium melleum]
MSWQTTFALACAALVAAAVPGTVGYATARLETADRQHQELVRLRAELQAARQTVRQVTSSCEPGSGERNIPPWAPAVRSGNREG